MIIRNSNLTNLDYVIKTWQCHVDFKDIFLSEIKFESIKNVFLFENSNLTLGNFRMNNINCFNSLYVFKFFNVSATINDILIKNFFIRNSQSVFFIEVMKSETHENFLFLNSSKFENIKEEMLENIQFDFLSMDKRFGNIKIDSCVFKQILISGRILKFLNFIMHLLVQNTKFIENLALNNIYLESADYFSLLNVTCLRNNHFKDRYNNDNKGEACFLIKNTNIKEVRRLKIINCFSNLTAPGLVFFDNDKINGNLTKKIIIIENSSFLKNFVYFKSDSLYEGDSISINSMAEMFVLNCIFGFNEIWIKNTDSFSIGGPCITAYFLKLAIIINSYFKENRSTKLSNGLIIYSETLLIISSLFYNNTILSFTDAMFKSKREKRWRIDSISNPDEINFSTNSKGGALIFSGNEIIIHKSFFCENKAYIGSAINTNNQYLNGNDQIILIYDSFFIKNDAILFSTIYCSLIKAFAHIISKGNIYYQNNAFECSTISTFPKTWTNLFFYNNFFFQNSANIGGLFLSDSSFALCKLYFSENLYVENKLKAFLIETGSTICIISGNTQLFMSYEKYYRNRGFEGLIGTYQAIFLEFKAIYIENYANTAIIFGLSFSICEQNGTVFINNYGRDKGCIVFKQNCDYILSKGTIKNCSSIGGRKSSVLLIAHDSKSQIDNSLFINNGFGEENSIEIQSTLFFNIFKDCIFYSHSTPQFLFDIYDGDLIVKNSTFIKNRGGYFRLSDSDNIILERLKFYHQTSNYKFSLVEIERTAYIKINNSIFMNSIALLNIIDVANSNIYLERCLFQNVSSTYKKFIIQTQEGQLIINSSNFKNSGNNILNFIGGKFYLLNLLLLNSFNNSFKDLANFGAIQSINPISLEITNCSFINLHANLYGGVLSVINNLNLLKPLIILDRNFFLYNFAEKGGSLYLWKSDCIGRKFFNQNKAKYGGAIFAASEINFQHISYLLKITQSLFKMNLAEEEGGAINFFFVLLELEKNVLKHNEAFYGKDIASYPSKLRVMFLNTKGKNTFNYNFK